MVAGDKRVLNRSLQGGNRSSVLCCWKRRTDFHGDSQAGSPDRVYWWQYNDQALFIPQQVFVPQDILPAV